jgi:hypothetical protein
MSQVTAAQQQADRQAAMYRETDTRFWAQAKYKIGRKLDPHDPADAAYIPVWNAIYAQVAAEQRAHGWPTPTHRSDAVAGPLSAAAAASARAEQHAHAAADATGAGAGAARDQHLAAAELAHEEAHAHAAVAAAAQPPSVSPEVVREAGMRAEHGIPTSAPPNLSDEQRRELARQAIAKVLEVQNSIKRAMGAPADPARDPARPSSAPAPTPTTPAKREAASSPDGVAPGAQAELDASGRVKQPTGAPSQASRWWGVVAVGTLCVGAFVGAAVLSSRRSSGGPRRRRRAVPVVLAAR